MKYEQFIEQIRDYADRCSFLVENSNSVEDDRFRDWHHGLQDHIDTMVRQGYAVNCRVSQRHFRAVTTPRLSSKVYTQDLKDTQRELHQLISNYEKFGIPVVNSEKIELNEKLTLRQVWRSMTFKLASVLVSVVVAIFMLGFQVGNWTSTTLPSLQTQVANHNRFLQTVEKLLDGIPPRSKVAFNYHSFELPRLLDQYMQNDKIRAYRLISLADALQSLPQGEKPDYLVQISGENIIELVRYKSGKKIKQLSIDP